MESRGKVKYFVSGLVVAGVLALILEFKHGYKIDNVINMFVAAGTFGAVVVALYISQRQEALRHKENLRLGLITVIRTAARIDVLVVNCETMIEMIEAIQKYRPPADGLLQNNFLLGKNIFDKFISVNDLDFSYHELTNLSYADYQMAVSVSLALDHFYRYYKYATRVDSQFALLNDAQFQTYKQSLLKNINTAKSSLKIAQKRSSMLLKQHHVEFQSTS